MLKSVVVMMKILLFILIKIGRKTHSHGSVFDPNRFIGVNKAIFMHDPIGFDTLWGFSFVEHQSLLDTKMLSHSSTQ